MTQITKDLFQTQTLNSTEAIAKLSNQFDADSFSSPKNFVKTIDTIDEYYSSEEFKNVYSYYCSSVAKRAEKVGRKFNFIKGFVTKENPETNYGKDFNLWRLYSYNSKDGIRFSIMQETAGGALTSARPNIAFLTNDGFILSHLSHDSDKFFVENQLISWK